MSILEQTSSHLDFRPSNSSGVYDEAFGPDGKPRAPWAQLAESARQIPVDEFLRRSAQAEEQLRENGVTFNVFQEGSQHQRPWRLDLLPVIYGAAEWRKLEQGLSQRAKLLEWIVRDCHGPQQLLHDGTLPAEVLFANPRFVRAFKGLHQERVPSITMYAAEIARRPDGLWQVMADRAESPAGMAFALENRIVVARTIPPELQYEMQRLAPFFVQMQQSFRRLGLKHGEHPRVVLLSAGSKARFFFEDTYPPDISATRLSKGETSPSATTGCTSRPWLASRRSTSSSPAAATAGSIPWSWGAGPRTACRGSCTRCGVGTSRSPTPPAAA